jgi:hypothetical protein
MRIGCVTSKLSWSASGGFARHPIDAATRNKTMKTVHLTLSLAVAALASTVGGPAKAEGKATPSLVTDEYTRQMNQSKPVPGTHESRSAERKVKRAELKQENRSGQIPEVGEDWGTNGNKPPRVGGTHETRSAERKAIQADLRKQNKAGELPETGEDWGMNKTPPARSKAIQRPHSVQSKAKGADAETSDRTPMATEAQVSPVR